MARRPAPKRLGEKLLQIRMALELSQTGIVQRLDYEDSPLYPAQISNFEQGKREPPLQLLLAYARLANIPLEILADDKLDLPAKLPTKPKHS
ncbi:MAG TPA: helix-turn-helix transcriptional regulator [Pyrinomonadaceae bacterium]|nr:helix-turn-helix transcriptional regulator [Pyrinomonadaceae bacterium]